MCKIIDYIVQRERKEAAIETEKKTCITTARQLIAYGETDIEKIAKCCSLSVDEVKELMAEHSA